MLFRLLRYARKATGLKTFCNMLLQLPSDFRNLLVIAHQQDLLLSSHPKLYQPIMYRFRSISARTTLSEPLVLCT